VRGQFSVTHRIVVSCVVVDDTGFEPSLPKHEPSAVTRFVHTTSFGHCEPPAARLAFAWNVNVLVVPFTSSATCHTIEPFAPIAGSENGAGVALSLYVVYEHIWSVITTFCRSTSPVFSTLIS